MDETTRWSFGLVVTVFLAAVGAVIKAFRTVSGKMAALHVRVDEVKHNYVRRDDMAIHMASLEKTLTMKSDQLTDEVSDLRDDLREHNKSVLAALAMRAR